MPIYMDRHDVSEKVTAENVAELHQADLKIQDQFNCRGLTYWFDDQRKTAFCLIEAPDEESLVKMHNFAHGEVPHQVIEVDTTIVESFLGRIEDPEKAKNTELNIINDPAFRIVLVTQIEFLSFSMFNSETHKSLLKKFETSAQQIIRLFNGSIVKHSAGNFLLSFKKVTSAVQYALKIHSEFQQIFTPELNKNVKFNIGISCGIPVTTKKSMFEDTIQLSERLCSFTKSEITTTSEVEALYRSENQNNFINNKSINALADAEEKLMNHLLDHVEQIWRHSDIKIDDIGKHLGLSRSQLYRKMQEITGISPNTFLKKYRIHRALQLLRLKTKNISEVAFECGFVSPSYFSKCFQDTFNITPSQFQTIL